MISNRIVTRGLGVSRGGAGRSGPVTMGYGTRFRQVVEQVINAIIPRRRRSSGDGKQLRDDEAIVWARLVEVNGTIPSKKVSGSVRAPAPRAGVRVIIEHVSSRVTEAIRIIAKRLR